MNVIRAFIVDDDEACMASLDLELTLNFQDVEIIGKAETVIDAVKQIDDLKPDLLFLDIELPDGNAFDIISKTAFKSYKVIFTTSHTEHALKAFEYSALHYIVKPVTTENIEIALKRFSVEIPKKVDEEQVRVYLDTMLNKPTKIAIPIINGIKIFNINTILKIESFNNYTKFYFINGEEVISSKSLTKFESILPSDKFIRIHNRFIISYDNVVRITKGRYHTVLLNDGTKVLISDNKKDEFYQNIKKRVLLA